MTYKEKRDMYNKLEKRTVTYQTEHPKSEIKYDREGIYNALKILIDFLHTNAPLCNMENTLETGKLPNPVIGYAGAYFLMMISELQTQGVIDTYDFIDIADNLTDHDGIAIAFSLASHYK